ncbi:hypothetical protein KIMC2_11590 [Xylocopilactobacillus apis]|uniref:DUF4767 domain-containing protein n=1 Tax=Xylocopilactobacillus apis TaxID=2932183 RepID=A0AAU9D751_9LACO|nr:DUF4767 domain-containing protein [Xylocopilactobacillus apis]BDR56597.1 hypothetical protein KIMC2_11590 [Xylocopilactobacillus apis]
MVPRGDQEAEYQVVAVATAVEGVTTYLFTLHNGQPVVFYTQTSNGSRMYLYDSQNFALQSGFAKIVTGNSMPEMSNSNLNNDVQARIKMKEIPLSYRHVWYYFNDQTKKVEQFDFTHRPSDMGLNYSSDHWVLIKDVEEEGIDNFKMFLRYRFFDGKQIPVAMLKDETLFNCYLDPNQIEIMHNFKYGDESN